MVQKRSALFFLGWLFWSFSAVSLPKEERERNCSHEQDEACEYEVIAVSTSLTQNSWHCVCWATVECVSLNLIEALDECHKKKIGHQPVDLEDPFEVVALVH